MRIPQNRNEFCDSLELASPPEIWPEALKAVWWEANGNWDNSHEIAQDITSEVGNWIHAYLHRKEGDDWNAAYWYRQANRDFPKNNLEEEFDTIVDFIISQ